MTAQGIGKLTFIDGIMNQYVYLSILKNIFHASVQKMGLDVNNYHFQQDNDHKHTAYDVKLLVLYNTKYTTAPQSPDLNPIENL